MKNRKLWLCWYSLFIICALCGIIPNPQGFWRFLFIALSIAFFIPGGLLLKDADHATARKIRTAAIASLSATTVLICLNYLSALMPPVWGQIFHYALAVISTPMFCGQVWIISLFGWSCLLSAATTILKRK